MLPSIPFCARLEPGVYVAYPKPALPLGVGNAPNSEIVGLGARLLLPPPPFGRGGNLGVVAELADEALPFRDGTCGGGGRYASFAALRSGDAGALERCMTACANMSSSALVSSMCCDDGLSVRLGAPLASSVPNRPITVRGGRYGLDRPEAGAELLLLLLLDVS